MASTRPLDAGELLKPESVTTTQWPASRPIADAFLKTGDVVGRMALYPLAEGEPILARDLSVAGGGGLAAKIPDGMRAIALRSDEVAGVAGFLMPGSRVDVLATYRAAQSAEPVTVTALQDAAVLAIGQRAQPDPDGKPATVTVVTLLLSPAESEKAVLASTQGTIHFVLRNATDRTRPESVPMGLPMLSGAAHPAGLTPVAPTTVSTHRRTPPDIGVETVLGDEAAPTKAAGQP